MQVCLEPGIDHEVSVPSAYLISAGQGFNFTVSASPVNDAPRLIDARGVVSVEAGKPGLWVYDLPTTRPLSEIMRDALGHFEEFPTHGIDCACMDNFIREIRAQATSSVPALTEESNTTGSLLWANRQKTVAVIKYLLNAAGRYL